MPWLLCSFLLSKLTVRMSCPCCQVSSREHRGAADSLPSERGDVLGLDGTAGAAEMTGAWVLASLPAFSCKAWLFGPGLAQLPVPGKQTWVVHTGLYLGL